MDLKTISKKIAKFKQKLVKNSEISIKNVKLLPLSIIVCLNLRYFSLFNFNDFFQNFKQKNYSKLKFIIVFDFIKKGLL